MGCSIFCVKYYYWICQVYAYKSLYLPFVCLHSPAYILSLRGWCLPDYIYTPSLNSQIGKGKTLLFCTSVGTAYMYVHVNRATSNLNASTIRYRTTLDFGCIGIGTNVDRSWSCCLETSMPIRQAPLQSHYSSWASPVGSLSSCTYTYLWNCVSCSISCIYAPMWLLYR